MLNLQSLKKAVLSAAILVCFNASAQNVDNNLDELVKAAQAEGQVNSLGMPDHWANWVGTWNDIKNKYGIEHSDTDMSSAQEIAKFKAEKNNATADIGDVGEAFTKVAVAQGVTQAYKPTTWDSIPDWAKDKDGHYALAYTGTISFMINKDLVKKPPRSWNDLLTGDYNVCVGDVSVAAQASSAVLAAAMGLGGDETNIKPALDFFAKIAKQGRLIVSDPSIANLEKGEIEVALVWDFNALNYAHQINKDQFLVVIPQEGSLVSGYSTIINKYAKHPNAAKLAREYIFSDAGQINLARGFARPIRSDVNLPEDVKAMLIPQEQYKNARNIKDHKKWEQTAKQLPRLWQQHVLINMQ